MALDITNDQAVKDFVNKQYNTFLGGDAAGEGQKYWGDQIKAGTLKAEDLGGHLSWSHEGQQYAGRKADDLSKGISTTERWAGGVDPNKTLAQQVYDNRANIDTNPDARPAWLGKYDTGGDRAPGGAAYTSGRNAVSDLTAINNELGLARDYNVFGSGTDINPTTLPPVDNTGGGGDDGATTPAIPGGGLTIDDLDEWWAGKNQNSGGMDDFMKFMMLMSVMGGGRGMGGGGGYGGSQYGYGGLNPGGVQAAYNPWENMTKGWDFMKTAFGSGSNDATTTALTNAT